MNEKNTELSVSTEVLEKMAELAAKEIDGVVGLAKKKIDLKGVVKTGRAFKGVQVENEGGALCVSVYICVKPEVNVRTVSEAVQQTVKERIQSMTGTAVSRVDVIVADIDTVQPEEEKVAEKTEAE